MICNGCDQVRDDSELTRCVITEKQVFLRFARCCTRPTAGVPDVYWDGKPEENLADGPDGKPITFSSKSEKAAYLKERGIMEAGDRHHGAPVSSVEMESRRQQIVKENNRREIKESVERVKQMDPRRRSAEYQRIVKEGERYARR